MKRIVRSLDAIGVYGCISGYELVGVRERICKANGWSKAAAPICVRKYQECLVQIYLLEQCKDTLKSISSKYSDDKTKVK